jgi:hypothetical protein
MSMNWKIAIIGTALVAAGLLVALVLARPVQRTVFRVMEPGGLEQQLAKDFMAIEGVHDMWLEAETGTLVVDHCPELEHRHLLQMLSARGSEAETMSSKRIHAIQAGVFPAGVAGSGSGRACRQDRPCATSASWRELLGRWRGGN